MDHSRTRFGAVSNWMWTLSMGAALLVATAVPRAHAQSQEEIDRRCQQRIQHSEHDLHEAIEHHGRESRQAQHERRELRDARDRCWRERQRWWDEHEHRWHTERDWDDRDHDRY
ncbi:MAG TPA: hypothetical protein VMU05_17805 [Dongiaceae bacterium]|nr:hypothetical protein [Dongiaceae bacterium]